MNENLNNNAKRNGIDITLDQRNKTYGEFKEHARITQNIKKAMVDSPNWSKLDDAKKEALEMLAHKVGRILNGDPEFHDSWHDIIGYMRLVEKELVPTLFSSADAMRRESPHVSSGAAMRGAIPANKSVLDNA